MMVPGAVDRAPIGRPCPSACPPLRPFKDRFPVGRELGDLRTHRAADGHHLVSAVLRLYRQSLQPERIRCLDIIDRLSQAGAYGLTAALGNER
jgi:hypothetical protein